ncbi:MAG: HAMP domain-containing protein [Desulfuromonadaceae bacterium]
MVKISRLHMGLAPRIALLSWLLTLFTLIIFALLIIPQQKKAFLQNLESKANSVAVSLHDVAAGAAINDDLASVVSASQTLLAGDPDLDFLIITKNDGFSLINRQSGWSAEPHIDSYWLPQKRESSGQIATVPNLNLRVFHYAQPFDYSGIKWGWIHVGLSLKNYDQSVALLYRNTIGLALGCIILSLLISIFYARQVERPILRLRQLVQQIAGGDLDVRADIKRQDELGSLAHSVNTMAEALLRRDLILESVRYAAQQFLQAARWEDVIFPVLKKIGRAASVERAYLYQNRHDENGQLCMVRRCEWKAETEQQNPPEMNLPAIAYRKVGLQRWETLLAHNEIIAGPVAQMSTLEQAALEPQQIRSLIVIPIFVEGIWWGFIGLDDCAQERIWTDAEKDSLRAGADILGATILRQSAQDALLEAKSTLEQRVLKRTRELQTQVSAKEKALDELAEAQNSLLELSRSAGMAEVATGVLHNVGNVLNSVNVSCTLLTDQLLASRITNVAKIAELLAAHRSNLPEFLTEDARGQQLPDYLIQLAPVLLEERDQLLHEARSLRERVDHIKEIVAMQQSYGRVSGLHETIAPTELLEDALKLNSGALTRHGIQVDKEYQDLPPIVTDKHRVLQILLNLIQNAKYACRQGTANPKIITLCLFAEQRDRVYLQVKDNGVGIPPENLARIFQHGFTTRRNGHGFGLHSGALAARELGGRLTVQSDGPERGAVFTLELPSHPGEHP